MSKLYLRTLLASVVVAASWSSVEGAIVGVSGPNSNLGTAPAIIAAPSDVLDDLVTNTGMQGFNEAQGVTTTFPYLIDGIGVIPAKTKVDSHMIFLNTRGNTFGQHREVIWTFDRNILGVMSDYLGLMEALSSAELGNPGTNYTVTSPGSGPAAPFRARGLEHNDSYRFAGNRLQVNMRVTEPGDWIRVVTSGPKVPEPSTWASLIGLCLVGFAGRKLRRRRE